MNASATSDFSPPESSDSRFVDLPGGVTSISTPGLRLLVLVGSGRPRAPRSSGGGSPPTHRARAASLGLHEPQAPAAAREEVLDDLLEVPRGRLEGLLERLADAPVGLLDQPLELGERALEVGALRLELLDVRHRLVVLLLRERVHGAELLAPALQALDPLGRARRAPRRAAARWRARPASPSRPASSVSSRSRVGGGVAHLLGGDLGAGHGLARAASAGPAARPPPGRTPSARRRSPRRPRRRPRARLRRRRGAWPRPRGRARARRSARSASAATARSRSAPVRRAARRGRAPRAPARSAPRAAARRAGRRKSSARRTASGPSSRRLAAAGDQPLGAAHRLGGLGGRSQGRRSADSALFAGGVGLRHRGGVLLYRRTRLRLVANGLL